MLMTKLKISSLALAVMLICSSSVYSQVTLTLDPTISVGANESISLSTIGAADVDALNLTLVVGDGGAILGGSDSSPEIVSVEGQGILAPSGTGLFAVESPQVTITTNSISGGPVALDGAPVAEIFFDTTALSPGDTFNLSFDAGPGTNPTAFFAAGDLVETNFADNFVVTVVGGAAVPEPSSAVILLALGGMGLIRRNRA